MNPKTVVAGRRSRWRSAWTASLLSCVIAIAGPVLAGGGDDHSHGPETPVAAAGGMPRLATQTDIYQVVGTLKDGRLAIYVDRFADNEPVVDAEVAVTIGEDTVEAVPTGEGTYALVHRSLSGHGQLEMIFNVSSSSGDDLIPATLVLPEAAAAHPAHGAGLGRLAEFRPSISAAALGVFVAGIGIGAAMRKGRTLGFAAAIACVLVLVAGGYAYAGGGDDHTHDPPPPMIGADTPQRQPDGFVFVPKITQRLLEVRTLQTTTETVTGSTRLIGRVVTDPNRGGTVQSINGGRIVPPEGGMPTVGKSVRKGEILAYVERPIIQADQATVLERMGDIEQQIALAEAKLARARRLVESNVGTRVAVTDLEIELEGLRRRRKTVDDIRTQPEILRAPADGLIASSRVAAGQVVAAQDVLFTVVDPSSLWVEALSFDGGFSGPKLATATTTDGDTLQLSLKGVSRTLQQQATMITYAVSEPPASLRVGEPVTVLSPSGGSTEGIVLPRSALTKSTNGETVVWRHVDPERFEPRPVRVEALDAARVVIRAGIAEGDRVVVRGADLVNQIR